MLGSVMKNENHHQLCFVIFEKRRMNLFELLPDEVILVILFHLPPKSFCHMMMTCRRLLTIGSGKEHLRPEYCTWWFGANYAKWCTSRSIDIFGMTSLYIFLQKAPVFTLSNASLLSGGYRKIRYLPKEVYLLTSLQSLNLYNNELTTIPEGISAMKNLTTLSLSHNKIKRLPSDITTLTSLRVLQLDDNRLTRDRVKGLECMTWLKELDLKKNPCTTT
jgi:hypothetical protein